MVHMKVYVRRRKHPRICAITTSIPEFLDSQMEKIVATNEHRVNLYIPVTFDCILTFRVVVNSAIMRNAAENLKS